MSARRKWVRAVARTKSYKDSGTTNLFEYLFKRFWRDKGHPASVNGWGASKKGHKPKFV